MPELPEVESTRRTLEPLLLGRRVLSATLTRRDILTLPGDPPGGRSRSRPTPAQPEDLLAGQTIASLRRHGKQMAIVANSGRALVVHLGMSGNLFTEAPGPSSPGPSPAPPTPTPAPAHRHAHWLLDDGQTLAFTDPRRFGGLWALPDPGALEARWALLGPDALTITTPQLRIALGSSRRPLKAALLDQNAVAGIGNIYADESLHHAGLCPTRPAHSLTAPELNRLASALRTLLRRAVQLGGSTLRDGGYRNGDGEPGSYQSAHAVYARAGQPCPRCGLALWSDRVAGRTTVWCRTCQPPG